MVKREYRYSTRFAAMLQDKLHTFVARFTVPLVYLLETIRYTASVYAGTSKLPVRSAVNTGRLIVSYPGETAGLSAW